MFEPRTYRNIMNKKGMTSFTVKYKETDLWISVDNNSYSKELHHKVFKWIKNLREQLELYISNNTFFAESLKPVKMDLNAPDIAKKMINAAYVAEVGPMAAVAGAFSQNIGEKLLGENVQEIIIENGGDLYINVKEDITAGVYAGTSPLSNQIGIKISCENMPAGVCTSAGTVGHSLSFGKSDAVVAVSSNTLLADCCATSLANIVNSSDDINAALEYAKKLSGLLGVLIIVEDKMGVWGDINIKKL